MLFPLLEMPSQLSLPFKVCQANTYWSSKSIHWSPPFWNLNPNFPGWLGHFLFLHSLLHLIQTSVTASLVLVCLHVSFSLFRLWDFQWQGYHCVLFLLPPWLCGVAHTYYPLPTMYQNWSLGQRSDSPILVLFTSCPSCFVFLCPVMPAESLSPDSLSKCEIWMLNPDGATKVLAMLCTLPGLHTFGYAVGPVSLGDAASILDCEPC